jgi:1,4-dihydroxy-2-naphthoyl-CoA hydrolase
MIARCWGESWSKVAIASNDSLHPMADGPVQQLDLEHTLDGVLGFELVEIGEERARARFEVSDRVRQPLGLVHGGAYAALAESLVSASTYMAVAGEGMIAVGQSNHTSFVRPVSAGTVHAEARRRHRGRSSWVWDVDFSDQDGRLCALSRVTLAVRSAERA